MYGTVGRLRVKPGRLADLLSVVRELETVAGVRSMAIIAKDGNESEHDWTILWEDKAAHDANGTRAEFPEIYMRLLDTLSSEPDWHSGEIVYQCSL